MKNSTNWAVWAVIAALTVAAFGAMTRDRGTPAAGPAQLAGDGPKAPDFTARTMDGKTVSLSDYKGKLVLLDFWATWCPPCRDEAPNVVSTYRKYKDRGFEVLGVSLDEQKNAVSAFANEYGMDWPQIFDADTDNEMASKYNIVAIPTMLLIDGDTGRVVAENPRGTALGAAVEAALNAKS